MILVRLVEDSILDDIIPDVTVEDEGGIDGKDNLKVSAADVTAFG